MTDIKNPTVYYSVNSEQTKREWASVVNSKELETLRMMVHANQSQLQAIKMFCAGEIPSHSTYIDETTETHGYGALNSHGVFEFDLPDWFYQWAKDKK